MPSYTIEIHPKSSAYDPQARRIKAELEEEGTPPNAAVVYTCRLYKIEGKITLEQAQSVAAVLLVDPVIEKAVIEMPKAIRKKKSKNEGIVLDVWPKPGVTDPVGETVRKGMHDLGYTEPINATSAHRYVFPKIKDTQTIRTLAQRFLANELIHDIHIRKSA